MTMKTLLSTASLALLLGEHRGSGPGARSRWGISPTIRVPTSDVGTPFGQGVADTYAWINKNGGIDGKPRSTSTPSTTAIRCRARSPSTRNGRAPTRSPPFSAGAPPTPKR